MKSKRTSSASSLSNVPVVALSPATLAAVTGGEVSPRDHASGLPTGKRQHKPAL